MRKTVSTIAIAAALLIGGCGKHFGGQPTETSTDTGTSAAAATNVAAEARQAPEAAPTAQQFVDQAASGDAFEIAAANLALKLAKSPDVRSFAAMMITEHTATTAEIRKAAAASAPALTPRATLSEDQRNRLQDLGALTGGEFDDRYADGQVSAHEAALTLMQTYADKGQAGPLKDAAADIVGKVQGHLDQIRAIRHTL
ncbi:DUF4142 domain-containing protein [Sphingomonas oligophenolica]|uniref:DUF4142 domain-containing protein n=1 Tax=Sphingomonas oligophenolica TaxID=301154 RepID=A0ABU9Y0F6_9SPHN